MIILFLISSLIVITKILAKAFSNEAKGEDYTTKSLAVIFSLGIIALRFTVLYRCILNYTIGYLEIDYIVSIELSIVIALVLMAFGRVGEIDNDK